MEVRGLRRCLNRLKKHRYSSKRIEDIRALVEFFINQFGPEHQSDNFPEEIFKWGLEEGIVHESEENYFSEPISKLAKWAEEELPVCA